MGDDFENAFLMTYGKDAWAHLRLKGEEWNGVNANIWGAPGESDSWQGRTRLWLSHNSMVYRLVVHGPVFGRLKGALQIRAASNGRDKATTALMIGQDGIEEAFRPESVRDRLNPDNPAVREGMRITLELLKRMDKACHEHGCRLVVVLIPTKEMVFAEHLRRAPRLHLGTAIEESVRYGEDVKGRVETVLDEAGIYHVDTLPALRARIADGLYTRSARDMHPAAKGYRVIGEVVANFLAQK